MLPVEEELSKEIALCRRRKKQIEEIVRSLCTIFYLSGSVEKTWNLDGQE
jgi:hypothetical protein